MFRTWIKDIPKPIWIFSAFWLIAGLAQAALMDLHPDEAYQWNLSKHLDWGYFHHPPMIVAFIKAGYAIFKNELGVRLLTVLVSTAGVPMLFSLSETKDAKTFILIYSSFILTHAGVFMAAPDSPLIFFSIVFLLLLKRYLENDSYILAILLAFVVAAMMYSKYHAIIFLGSALLTVPKLLLRKSFWLIAIVSVIAFLPHVLWQVDNDYISYKFNWIIREKSTWKPIILLDYLLGQLILLGPVGILVLLAISKSRLKGSFNRVLISTMIGVFGFFLIMGLRGKVEANWTALAFLPILVLGSRTITQCSRLKHWLKPMAFLSIGLLVIARCYLASPWAGNGLPTVFPLKGWKDWALAIKEKADGKPVFFFSSYQKVAQYSFYSGEQGYHFTPLNYNGNHYQMWDIDKEHFGDTIALYAPNGPDPSKAVEVDGFSTMYCFDIPNYRSYRWLRLAFPLNSFDVVPNSTLELKGKLVNNLKSEVNLDSLIDKRPLKIFYYLDGLQTPAEDVPCAGCSGVMQIGEEKEITISVKTPPANGKYFIRFGFDFALGMPEANSDFIKLNVTEKQ